jgi:hypothetical protein
MNKHGLRARGDHHHDRGAAEPRLGRLRNAEHEGHRHGRVHGVATLGENLESRESGLRGIRAHRAIHREGGLVFLAVATAPEGDDQERSGEEEK